MASRCQSWFNFRGSSFPCHSHLSEDRWFPPNVECGFLLHKLCSVGHAGRPLSSMPKIRLGGVGEKDTRGKLINFVCWRKGQITSFSISRENLLKKTLIFQYSTKESAGKKKTKKRPRVLSVHSSKALQKRTGSPAAAQVGVAVGAVSSGQRYSCHYTPGVGHLPTAI